MYYCAVRCTMPHCVEPSDGPTFFLLLRSLGLLRLGSDSNVKYSQITCSYLHVHVLDNGVALTGLQSQNKRVNR